MTSQYVHHVTSAESLLGRVALRYLLNIRQLLIIHTFEISCYRKIKSKLKNDLTKHRPINYCFCGNATTKIITLDVTYFNSIFMRYLNNVDHT